MEGENADENKYLGRNVAGMVRCREKTKHKVNRNEEEETCGKILGVPCSVDSAEHTSQLKS